MPLPRLPPRRHPRLVRGLAARVGRLRVRELGHVPLLLPGPEDPGQDDGQARGRLEGDRLGSVRHVLTPLSLPRINAFKWLP